MVFIRFEHKTSQKTRNLQSKLQVQLVKLKPIIKVMLAYGFEPVHINPTKARNITL